MSHEANNYGMINIVYEMLTKSNCTVNKIYSFFKDVWDGLRNTGSMDDIITDYG